MLDKCVNVIKYIDFVANSFHFTDNLITGSNYYAHFLNIGTRLGKSFFDKVNFITNAFMWNLRRPRTLNHYKSFRYYFFNKTNDNVIFSMALVMLPCDLPWWTSVQRHLKHLLLASSPAKLTASMLKIHDMCK